MARIFLIEDDDDVAKLASSALTKHGHEVTRFANGLVFFNQLPPETPDLILTDLLMPKLDGFTVLERVRKTPALAAVPVIAMTALEWKGTKDLERRLFKELGAVALLRKPFAIKALFEVTDRAMGVSAPEVPGRQHERLSASFAVRFSSADALVREYTDNISAGGIFVVSSQPPAVQTEVRIHIEVPGLAELPTLCGRVVHVTPPGAPSSGFGVQLSLGEAERGVWQGVVDGLRLDAPVEAKGALILALGFRRQDLEALSSRLPADGAWRVQSLPSLRAAVALAQEKHPMALLLVDVFGQGAADKTDASLLKSFRAAATAPIAFVGIASVAEVSAAPELNAVCSVGLSAESLAQDVISWLSPAPPA